MDNSVFGIDEKLIRGDDREKRQSVKKVESVGDTEMWESLGLTEWER